MADRVSGSAGPWPGGAVPSFSDPGLLDALEGAPVEALDDLAFGLITMDRHGVVLHYNADGSRRSGLSRERVLGRDFFGSVGPCADHPRVAGRFVEAAGARRTLDEELDFTFTFRMRLSPVRLRLLAAAGSPRQYLAVRDPWAREKRSRRAPGGIPWEGRRFVPTDRPPQTGDMSTPVVTVLGTGTMGAGMVRSLRRAGLAVRAWNRDPAKARALTDTGAQAFDSPAEAADGADVVLTMLLDADAVLDVVRQAAPATGTVWLQTSTVGLEGADRTVAAARELGLVLVDCPVLGTKQPAEKGALVLLASGPEEVRPRLAPVCDALGSKTLWLGEAGAGSRLKMACNAWLFALTAGVAQSVALARGLGLDPRDFLAAIEGGPLDVPYAHLKAGLMLDGEYPVSFALAGAAKDARLIRAALRTAEVDDRLTTAVLQTMEAAADRLPDPGAVDMAVLVTGLTQGR